MPSDFAVHSDLLVHWTGKDIDQKYQPNWPGEDLRDIPEVNEEYLHRLRDILSMGFWMTTQEAHTLPGRIPVPAAPGLCFTELKLSQSKTHAMQYGRLGIAVKRPFLFERGGRPVVYYHPRRPRFEGKDIFLKNCSRELVDKRLLQFFKPMDSNDSGRIKYDYYSESEWRIIADGSQSSDLIVDPREAEDKRIIEYFNSLTDSERDKLKFLVPLNGWLAAIIYPSLHIKNKAQEDGSEVYKLIRKIARTRDHAYAVEGDNLPAELDLGICQNF